MIQFLFKCPLYMWPIYWICTLYMYTTFQAWPGVLPCGSPGGWDYPGPCFGNGIRHQGEPGWKWEIPFLNWYRSDRCFLSCPFCDHLAYIQQSSKMDQGCQREFVHGLQIHLYIYIYIILNFIQYYISYYIIYCIALHTIYCIHILLYYHT